MNIKRMATRFAAILITMVFLLTAPLWLPNQEAQALDFSLIETKLNTWQYYFCRTLMSVSLKDYYDRNGIAYDHKIFPDCASCGHCCSKNT